MGYSFYFGLIQENINYPHNYIVKKSAPFSFPHDVNKVITTVYKLERKLNLNLNDLKWTVSKNLYEKKILYVKRKIQKVIETLNKLRAYCSTTKVDTSVILMIESFTSFEKILCLIYNEIKNIDDNYIVMTDSEDLVCSHCRESISKKDTTSINEQCTNCNQPNGKIIRKYDFIFSDTY
jgi:hypothetical protein